MDVSWVELRISLHIMNELNNLELNQKLEYPYYVNLMNQKDNKLKNAYENHFMKMIETKKIKNFFI